MELLRFITAGSVDDGKSTLIGRLLFDSGSVFADQLVAAQKASGAGTPLDFSLITDGLSAEREQKITIDVAYRYFSTAKRTFILADVPGHEEYTRNMVTAASTANVAVLLVNPGEGLKPQSKRHLFLASLMGVSHVVVAVNKMDIYDYREEIFQKTVEEIASFAAKLPLRDLQFIPVSALNGDNIVKRSSAMEWYTGSTLLGYLENVHIQSDRNLIDFRFPVQLVLRPDADFRGYAGEIASGTITKGEEVMILPSGRKTKIKSLSVGREEVTQAFAPQAAVIRLEDERDVSRGDMIIRTQNVPEIGTEFEAMLFWMSREKLEVGQSFLIKHTTNTTRCFVTEILYAIDIGTLHRKNAKDLDMNDIGRVRIKTSVPLMFDSYQKNKATGSAVLIDEFTNATVGGCIITDEVKEVPTYVES